MREINFRGKDAETNKWIFGYYTFGMKHRITYWDGNSWYDRVVIPESVGQSTGLTSSNGKEIYEGDIIILGGKKEFPRVIEWYVLGLRVKQINGAANFPLYYPFVGQTGLDTDWEIIGNTYENPEFFKSVEKV